MNDQKKKRLTALLLSFCLAVSSVSFLQIRTTAEPDTGNDTHDDTSVIAFDTSVTTGSQQRLRDTAVDADEDIAGDVEAQVEEEWVEIKIRNVEDLKRFAGNCRLDTWSRNKKVLLMNDLSLSGVDFEGIPTFGGVFDGQGHTVKDFDYTQGRSYTGFFNDVQKCGVIMNLNVSGKMAPAGKQLVTGILAGDNKGIISGCKAEGTLQGHDYVGMVAGINELSGIITDCESSGYIRGLHFTGGIAGENMGNIRKCKNRAKVNTTYHKDAVSPSDIDLDSYASLFLPEDDKTKDSANMVDSVVDCGGIAGLSVGVITECENEETVGYERFGYNIGGIAGRQSGYIENCTNRGEILGRKDVGGICGQAEPYVTVDLSKDIAYQLTENIEKLHGLLTTTIGDAGTQSDAISSRLSVIQQFTGSALDDTRYLADNTVTYANNVTGAVNEAFSRVDYILDESVKQDGLIDQVTYSADNAQSAADSFGDAIDDLDIFGYMSEGEKEAYDNDKKLIKKRTKEYDGYYKEAQRAYYNYYIFTREGLTDEDRAKEKDLAFYLSGDKDYTFNAEALRNPDKDAFSYTATDADPIGGSVFLETFGKKGKWVHHNNDTGEDRGFPLDEKQENGDPTEGARIDETLQAEAKALSAVKAGEYADKEYAKSHPDSKSYAQDIAQASEEMTAIITSHVEEMADETKEDAERAIDYISEASGNLSEAGHETKRIVSTVAEMDPVAFPELDGEYRAHTTSLADNLQGMNDNFGYLNTEMNGASNELLGDLQEVTDQFDKIMQLYTDAIDGVLDRDYENVIEDESLSVAEECTDATINGCVNRGSISGSIDVAGIAGTMAVEYDFDLESDVTGIKDANMNTTFITKCVLRKDKNYGTVTAEKSYTGGICGLQEMGTVLSCGGYGPVSSNTGDYAGGIAGSSLSYIVKSDAKCSVSAENYAGGIAGDGTHIYNCLAIPGIDGAKSWYGAIAGHVKEEGKVRGNYFVSDTLAGIDRISYALKASPVSYEELTEKGFLPEEELPEEFSDMHVTFVVSDDDGTKILSEKNVKYGEELGESVLESLPDREDAYPVWEDDVSGAVTTDRTVHVGYERYRTTLSGEPREGEKQPPVLVDGRFREGDKLSAMMEVEEEVLLSDDGTFEVWSIEIPDDGASVHQLRYIPGENVTARSKIGSKVEKRIEEFGLYQYKDGTWQELPSKGKLGKYYLYDVEGNHLKLEARILNAPRVARALTITLIVSGIALFAAAFLIIRFFVRRRRRIASAAHKIRNATHEAARNLGSQNQIFYHGEEDRHGDPVVSEEEVKEAGETPEKADFEAGETSEEMDSDPEDGKEEPGEA